MKNGSDAITACSGNEDNENGLPAAPDVVLVCGEETFMSSASQHDKSDDHQKLPDVPHTWGDFEGFSELTPQSDEFYYEDEELQFDSSTTTTSNTEHCTEQPDVQDGWEAFTDEVGNAQECERIFKLSFPDPPIEETDDNVNDLDALLMSDENAVSRLIKTRLWLDCNQSEDCPACDWPNSKGCRDLMSLLGVSAEHTGSNNKEITGVLTDPGMERSQVNEAPFSTGNKSLIQTKLDVVPGSKHGHIFSYQLFLKKPSADTALPFFSFSGRKSFFSTNQTPFNC
ncbi:uncharacterized protein CLBA1 [Hyperolius riggenbachi]|uniref:uncharacterized protein CLBA1 n=1 Tax=Hyperolius riggenbachi TaxID=752182 RepID=UPI0035A36788